LPSCAPGSSANCHSGLLIALGLLAEIELLVGLGVSEGGAGAAYARAGADACRCASNIEAIGALLYTQLYLFLFEMAGIILLVAMIGAIVLTHRARRGDVAEYRQAEPPPSG
jgi:NADH-quinone oxidoreductase subunit J